MKPATPKVSPRFISCQLFWVGLVVVVLAACSGGASESNSTRDAGGDVGSLASGRSDASSLAASGSIGPAGGVVTLGAASITIPPGALSSATLITLHQRSDFPPARYVTYSPFYEFDPAGVTFAIPATVVLPRYGGPASAAVYWSAATGPGYDRLVSTVGAHVASAQVTHFSTGFLGALAAGDASVDAMVTRSDAGRDATGRDGSESGTGDASHARDAASDGAGADARADAGVDGGTGTGCDIGGARYASGAVNPGNECQTCQPAVSAAAWSDAPNGGACGGGEICHSGACVLGCDVAGVFYAPSTPNPNNACQSCEPGASTSALTSVVTGTVCGNGQICQAGVCGTQCDVGGTIYPSATPNPSNACQTCQPGTSTGTWGALADGTSCGPAQVCSAMTCTSGCFIGGTVVASGAANPNNACQRCLSATSTTAWTTASDGTSCGNGELCVGGACGTECDIGGILYPSGTINAVNACQSCQPGTNGGGWTTLSDGTGCAAGEVCSAGSCSAGCFIAGTVYTNGALNPNNACQSCQPTATTTAWSSLANGAACGAGETCTAGTCAPSCAPACVDGNVCAANSNCSSGVCTGHACAAPACAPCTQGNACAGPDCASGVCTNGTCAPPACSPTCAVGAPCGTNADCATGLCDGVCTETNVSCSEQYVFLGAHLPPGSCAGACATAFTAQTTTQTEVPVGLVNDTDILPQVGCCGGNPAPSSLVINSAPLADALGVGTFQLCGYPNPNMAKWTCNGTTVGPNSADVSGTITLGAGNVVNVAVSAAFDPDSPACKNCWQEILNCGGPAVVP